LGDSKLEIDNLRF